MLKWPALWNMIDLMLKVLKDKGFTTSITYT